MLNPFHNFSLLARPLCYDFVILTKYHRELLSLNRMSSFFHVRPTLSSVSDLFHECNSV